MVTLTKKEIRPAGGGQGCDRVGLSLAILRRVMHNRVVEEAIRLNRSIISMLMTRNCQCTRKTPVLKIGDVMLTVLRVA